MPKKTTKEILSDFGTVLFLVLFPHFVPLPFYSYAIICFFVLIVALKPSGRNLPDIGLRKRGVTLKTIAVGILSALFWVAFMRWVFAPLISFFFTVPDYTEYDFIRNNISNLILTIVAAWVVGGFYEEVVFRGFIHSAFKKYSGSFWLSAFFTSVLFGLYHWQQGIFGVAAATLGGFYWSLVFKYSKENLWSTVLSHAIFDTITLTLIYLGLFGD